MREIVEDLAARVEERRARGEYDAFDWLTAEVAFELEAATPVDQFLQWPYPQPPWTPGAQRALGRVSSAAARATFPGLPEWSAALKETDELLRAALAWLRLLAQSEQWAREERDEILGRDIKELAYEIGHFQERVLTSLATLEARLAKAETDLEKAETDLSARVRALEIAQALQRQDIDSRSSQTRVVKQPSVQATPSTADFDYLGFENRFRGPEAVIRERLQHHVSRLRESYPVLDLGCGRGELLALLAEAGIPASGVDSDRAMAEAARQRGLAVTTGDLFDVLEAIEPASLGAVTAFHVIEHMDLASQVRLVRSARAALRPGGILILETPSPLSLVAGSINFLRDPTHVRPLHPDTLAYMVESEGFAHAEIELLAAVPTASRVPRVEANSERDDQINAALDVIDEVLFGHQDFAVVGTR